MVGGGLIAGSQTCCCENPPPSGCFCGDFCQYFIEVVSPSEVAVKSLVAKCSGSYQETGVVADRDISWLDDVVLPDQFGDPTVDCFPILGFSNEAYRGFASSRVGSSSYAGLYATTGVGTSYVTLPCGLPTISIGAGVRVRFSCSETSGAELTDPYIDITLDVSARTSYLRFGGYPEGEESYYTVVRGLRVSPETECYRGNAMACFPGGKKVIQTPLVIEATSTSTTLGAWGYSYDLSGGPDAAMLEVIVNQVLDKLAATFRITSRSSCLTVPRPCDTNSDCKFYLVTITGYPDPGCGAESTYAWFDSYEAAEAYVLPFLDDFDCGAISIDADVSGACCDQVEGNLVISRGCFPGPDDLPFFTNLEPEQVPCP
jgi:hypothetical protein